MSRQEVVAELKNLGIEISGTKIKKTDIVEALKRIEAGPYLDRVKKKLGAGFDAWVKKQDDPEKSAYKYVNSHNLKHIGYKAKEQQLAALKWYKNQIEDHLESEDLLPDEKSEWSAEKNKIQKEIDQITLDSDYVKPI